MRVTVVVIRVNVIIWAAGAEVLLWRTYGKTIPSDGGNSIGRLRARFVLWAKSVVLIFDLPRLRPWQVILLLESFQPSRIVYLIMALRATDCRGEDSRLVSDGAVV